MNRRLFLLSTFQGQEGKLNKRWQAFAEAANRWSTAWNSMVWEYGTVSIGEYKAWKEMEETFKQLREERKRQMEGR